MHLFGQNCQFSGPCILRKRKHRGQVVFSRVKLGYENIVQDGKNLTPSSERLISIWKHLQNRLEIFIVAEPDLLYQNHIDRGTCS